MLFHMLRPETWSLFTVTSFLLALCNAAEQSGAKQNSTLRPFSIYTPQVTSCPVGPLLRPALGISTQERAYITRRKRKASRALAEWLQNVDENFDVFNLPTLSMVSSGGGYRSMLLGAGIIQAFDARDSDAATNGLYQSFSYHAGLSGGAWLLSSIAGNDQATISTLKEELWQGALANNSLWPLNTDTAPETPGIKMDIVAKSYAGFPATISDVWGRFLSYQLLRGFDGGVAKRLSSVVRSASFITFNAPFPIITALGVNGIYGSQCDPPDDATQYEFHPYEFGSWDQGVKAFTPTAYLGSTLSAGRPTQRRACVENYDNLGYILGTSSSKFQEECGGSSIQFITSTLAPLLAVAHNSSRRDLYSPFRNPFYNSSGSPLVASQPELFLVDGGQANQNNPLWPFLQPARETDVVIVNDNSADTDNNYPNGTELYHTYVQAKAAGLTRMPVIPPVSEFVNKGLHERATFFGCNSRKELTIIYLPNVNYTFDSGQPSSRFEYTFNDTNSMIEAGAQIALQHGDPQWPRCLACAIVSKSARRMPSQCQACLKKYCYQP